MKVLILGFNDYDLLDREMNAMIEKSQCFIFTVLCGGTDKVQHRVSIAEEWAKRNGAPIEYIFNEDVGKLEWLLCKEADFLLCALEPGSPQQLKNLVMRYKSEGKHGRIVRKGE